MLTSSCACTVLAGIMTMSKTVSLGNTCPFGLKWSAGYILAPWVARSCSETTFIAPCFPRKENPDYTTFFQGSNWDYQNNRSSLFLAEGVYHIGETCVHCRKVYEANCPIDKQDKTGKFQVVMWVVLKNTGYSNPLLKMKRMLLEVHKRSEKGNLEKIPPLHTTRGRRGVFKKLKW